MKSFIFCFFFITLICNSQGFVSSLWSYFNEDNPEEKLMIENGKELLVTYENKNDCFKEASFSIRNQCSKLDQLDIEKIKYAIRLTICHHEMAEFEIPTICRMEEQSQKCLVALKDLSPQFWITYMAFYGEAVHMCLSLRYSIEKDLQMQFMNNMTNTYDDIIRGINILMSSLRDEEKARMPRISDALNGLVNEIKIIKSKSEFIMNEMSIVEEKFKSFQNNIQDAFSQINTKFDENLKHVVPHVNSMFEELNNYKEKIITSLTSKLNSAIDLSNTNMEKINSINQNLIGVEEIASKSLIEHQNLQDSVKYTKDELDELLTFSKNEIKKYSSYSENEFKKVTQSIDTITNTFSMINEFTRYIKKWYIIIPPVLSIFGSNSFYIGEIASFLFVLFNDEKLQQYYGYETFTHLLTMIIGSLLSKYALSKINQINKYFLLAFCVIKFFIIAYMNLK